MPLPAEVRNRQSIRLEADVDLRRWEEVPPAITALYVEPVGGEDRQSAHAVAVEVDGADHQRVARSREDHRVREEAVPQSREQADGVRSRVECDERGEPPRSEDPGGHAGGPLQARDRRWVGRPGDAVGPLAGIVDDGSGESPASEVSQHLDLPRKPVGHDDILQPILDKSRRRSCLMRPARPGCRRGAGTTRCHHPGSTRSSRRRHCGRSSRSRRYCPGWPTGSEPARDPWRAWRPGRTPSNGAAKNEIALSSVSTLAINGPRSVST